jgi:hypothetical protein
MTGEADLTKGAFADDLDRSKVIEPELGSPKS